MKRFKFVEALKDHADRISFFLFVFAASFLVYLYGFASHKYKLFPYSLMERADSGFNTLLEMGSNKLPSHYLRTDIKESVPPYDVRTVQSGLTKISTFGPDDRQVVRIIGIDGEIIHSWDLNWFDIWPDATHIYRKWIPKTQPGAEIDGSIVMANGDLVFNFSFLGMIRVDPCGEVIWKLPYQTHHMLYLDDEGYFWVPGVKVHDKPDPNLPNHIPDYYEYTILKVSPDGEILRELSILDLLIKNGLRGLLYLESKSNYESFVTGDTLHLNDVETFPSNLSEGVFSAGDIMVSLRDINAVLVFGQTDLKVKYMSIGGYGRQHDPDFIDGDTISVFDNNNLAPLESNPQSRIIIESAKDRTSRVHFEGNEDHPFFTNEMGKHQWLANGNLLITESTKGRAFEIDRQGKIVWQYINIVEPGIAGTISGAERLPPRFSKAFFQEIGQVCQKAN